MPRLVLLLLLVATSGTLADPQSVPSAPLLQPGPSTTPQDPINTLPLATKVDLGQEEEVKTDRAPLHRSSKILPFGPSLGGLPRGLGVSFGGFGLGLSVPGSPPHHHQHYPQPPPPPLPGVGVLSGASPPRCANGATYCLHHLSYPTDAVNSVIDRYYNDVTITYNDLYQIPSHDVYHYDNSSRHYRPDGHFVCEGNVEYVRPGWAENLRGEWVAILNTDKFPQTIRVETCRYGGKRCEYLPPCYKSQCIQRYTYVRLLSLTPYHPSHRPAVDVFKIPSACSCFVEDFVYY